MALELEESRMRSAASYYDDDSDDSLLSLDVEETPRLTRPPPPNLPVRLYTRFLAKFPYIIPILVIAGSVGCGVYSWKKHPLPDFDHPTKGFITRGTPLQVRALTLENIYQNVENGDLSFTPNQSLCDQEMGMSVGSMDFLCQNSTRKRRSSIGSPPAHRQWRASHVTVVERVHKAASVLDNGTERDCSWDLISPKETRYVFEGQDLLSAESLRAMCDIETKHITPHLTPQCPLKSIAHVVGLLTGKSCNDINEKDVTYVRTLLADCATYYYNRSLTTGGNKYLPANCSKNDFVSKIFLNFVPIDFMKVGKTEENKHSPLPSSVAYADSNTQNQDWRQFYEKYFFNRVFHEKGVQLTAIHLPNQEHVKYDIFGEYLLHDAWYFLLAASLIIVIMMIYLRSVVLTFATIINVGISFTFAYTIYHALPNVDFFPFMNLLTALVLIAVGADDVFIFHDAWEQAKQNDMPLCDVMAVTFSHAALSIFVTSLTTAAAFFANFVSQITAIKCFGLFSGIAILSNFVLMITWTPSIILCTEYVWRFYKRKCCPNITCKCLNVFTKASEVLFEKVFPKLIEKGWFVWIFILVGLGAGGCVVVFVNPKLNLPTSTDFQLFPSGNLLEHWDLQFENRFQAVIDINKQTGSKDIQLYFIWGFMPTDSGNYLDPDDKGTELSSDNSFNFYSNESQLWLSTFCANLKKSSFAPSDYTEYLCPDQSYIQVLRNFCPKLPQNDSVLSDKRKNCCEKINPPYDPETLEMCAPAIQLLLGERAARIMGSPIFNADNKIIGYMMNMTTTLDKSNVYNTMEKHYNTIQVFMDEEISSAPPGMKGVFFTAFYDFALFDLQKAISYGTYYSIVLSLSVAMVMMLLTSLNILITLYAIFTIGLAIVCTVATIVLMGWDLNILESFTISLAVGLSIDFAIHYGVAYRLSSAKTVIGRVNESFARVGSAVAMAALTTFAAGAAMMPSSILAYTKLGVFLMLVMAFSWVYSTFLFQSICRIAGPRGDFCQISLNCLLRRNTPTNSTQDTLSLNSSASADSLLVSFENVDQASLSHLSAIGTATSQY